MPSRKRARLSLKREGVASALTPVPRLSDKRFHLGVSRASISLDLVNDLSNEDAYSSGEISRPSSPATESTESTTDWAEEDFVVVPDKVSADGNGPILSNRPGAQALASCICCGLHLIATAGKPADGEDEDGVVSLQRTCAECQELWEDYDIFEFAWLRRSGSLNEAPF